MPLKRLSPPGAAQFTGFHFSTPVTILHECVLVILGQNRSLVNHLETDALVIYLESLKKKKIPKFFGLEVSLQLKFYYSLILYSVKPSPFHYLLVVKKGVGFIACFCQFPLTASPHLLA